MHSDKEIFSSWLKKVVKGEDVIKGKILAEKVGIAPSTISGWFHGKSKGPEKPIAVEICKILNADYDKIITDGRHEVQPDISLIEKTVRKVLDEKEASSQNKKPDNVIDYHDPIKVMHYKKVNEFPDPVTALELNTLAVELAHIDPKAVKEVIEFIKFKIIGKTKERSAPAKNGSTGTALPGE
jgi:transcriptional regulator with XRE-family HTH domain